MQVDKLTSWRVNKLNDNEGTQVMQVDELTSKQVIW